MDITTFRSQKRWIGFFDLLGFSKLVEQNKMGPILDYYYLALEQLQKTTKIKKIGYRIDFSWFSDSFLIYSKDDSIDSFIGLERASRLFFTGLLENLIPVRGAITFGEFYTQKEKNIFVGPALVEAVNYTNNQNWLGLILTPNSIEKINNFPILVIPYRRYRVPTETKRGKKLFSDELFVYDFSYASIPLITEIEDNIFLEKIFNMQVGSDEKYSEKYENTEKFIRKTSELISYSNWRSNR